MITPKKILTSAIPILTVSLLMPLATRPQQQSSAARSTPSSANVKSVSAPAKSQDAVSERPDAKGFPSPETAAAALCEAVRQDDTAHLLVILGHEGKDLVNWGDENDGVEEQRQMFVQKYDQMHRLVKEPDDTVALYVGPENWPLPIPIVEYKGAWYFDAALGKQEVLYRRVGRNEIAALEVSRALIDGEKEYYGIAHTFTSKFESSPNAHDGLHWKSGDTNTRSPVGPYLAQAGITDSVKNHQPFHGYFYRILLQNPVAPNGDAKNSASSNANNFVVVAFPAMYRSSGVMTFITDENGDAYEKDLGPTTVANAMQITSAHPDNTWNKVE